MIQVDRLLDEVLHSALLVLSTPFSQSVVCVLREGVSKRKIQGGRGARLQIIGARLLN